MANVNLLRSPIPIGISRVVSPVENPVRYVFESDVLAIGAAATFNVFFTQGLGIPVVGSYVEINGIRFNGVTNPAPDEFYLPIADTNAEWRIAMLTLLEAIKANSVLGWKYRFYYVEILPSFIIEAQAVNPGTAYDATFASTVVGSSSALGGGVDAYRGETFSDYAVWVEVWVQPLDVQRLDFVTPPPVVTVADEMVARLEVTLDATNEFAFDVAPLLASYLQSYPPDFTAVLPLPILTPCTRQVVGYYLKYGESYTFLTAGTRYYDPVGDLGLDGLESLWVINASDELYLTSYDVAFNFLDYWERVFTSNANRFLTNQIRRKVTQVWENEFLYVAIPERTPPSSIKINYSIQFENGLVIGPLLSNVFVDPAIDGGVFYFESGLRRILDEQGVSLLTLESTNGALVESFDIQLVDVIPFTPLAITEIMTYVLDNEHRCDEETAILYFLNTRGGFDSVACLGAIKHTQSSEPLNYRQTISPDGSQTNDQSSGFDLSKKTDSAQFDFVARDSWTLWSGVISKEEGAWLKELQRSTEIYLDASRYLNAGNPYPPITDRIYQRVTLKSFDFEVDSQTDNTFLKVTVEASLLNNTIRA